MGKKVVLTRTIKICSNLKNAFFIIITLLNILIDLWLYYLYAY